MGGSFLDALALQSVGCGNELDKLHFAIYDFQGRELAPASSAFVERLALNLCFRTLCGHLTHAAGH